MKEIFRRRFKNGEVKSNLSGKVLDGQELLLVLDVVTQHAKLRRTENFIRSEAELFFGELAEGKPLHIYDEVGDFAEWAYILE